MRNVLRLLPDRTVFVRFMRILTDITLTVATNGFNPLEPFSFGIFGKSSSNQILVEQGKVKLLLEKPCHFSENKFSKIRNTLWNFEIFFFAILTGALQTCILRIEFRDSK
jgi:hypothetical protein